MIDTIAVRKIGFWNKILRHLKSLFRNLQCLYPIQSVNPHLTHIIIQTNYIPTLFEHLDKIGLQGRRKRFIPIRMIGHTKLLIVPHRLDNRGQIVLAGRDVLKLNALFNLVALVDQIVHGKRVQ